MKKISFVLFSLLVSCFFMFGQEKKEHHFFFEPNLGDKFTDETQMFSQLDDLATDLKERRIAYDSISVDGYAAFFENGINPEELSEKRAIFLKEELIKRGVPSELFSKPHGKGYGSVSKWGDNSSEIERKPNRRAIVSVTSGIAVSFTGLTANGSAEETTTRITLIFDKDIEGLSEGDITLSSSATEVQKKRPDQDPGSIQGYMNFPSVA
ncbi:MAG: hypothetical protein LBB80_07730 [Treponema sp.]|jgi:hypothetical protein|nr:hypothetical protein [Treponema sp.]